MNAEKLQSALASLTTARNVRKAATDLLSTLRPGTDENIRAVVLFLMGQRIADSEPSRGASLLEAEKYVLEAIAIFENQPAQAAAWEESLHLLDRIWTTYAWLNPPHYFDQVIQKYQDLLEDPRLEQEPYEKALLLHSVSSLYYRHPGARPPEYIERGIDSLIKALMLLGSQRDGMLDLERIETLDEQRRQQSARSLSQLGNAYLHRKRGEQLENIQRAVDYYQMALRVSGGLDEAERQADTLYNLSIAYGSWATKAKKDREYLLNAGMDSGKKALERLRSIPSSTLKEAKLSIELGVLCSRFQDERGERRIDRLEEAMAHFRNALALLKPKENPFEWGNAHTHLGNAYYERARLSRTRLGQALLGPVTAIPDLNQARAHYLEALKFHTRESYPERWGNIQNNLGAVYSALNRRCLARESFQNTIRVGRSGMLNDDVRRSAMNLGNMEFFDQDWKAAAMHYQVALEAGEVLYRASITETGKKAELSDNVVLYQRAAYALAKQNDPNGALVLLENGKTRILHELIQLQNAEERPENVSAELWNEFQDARSLVQNSQVDPEVSGGDAFAYTRQIAEQEAALESFNTVVRRIQAAAPGFLRAGTLPDICSALQEAGTALVAFCVTELGSYAFILENGAERAQAVSLDPFDWARLRRLLDGDGSEDIQQAGWKKVSEKLGERRLNKADSQRYKERMEALLEEVGAALVQPVLAHLHPRIRKLILLPTGGLFLIPFHAVPLADGARLGDVYPVSYVPSVKILSNRLSRHAAASARQVYSVANTGVYYQDRSLVLDFAEVMEQEITSSDPAARAHGWQIRQERAEDVNKELLFANARGSWALNLYCHGRFEPKDPMQSGLLITYNEPPLTPAELRSAKMRLDSVRLLTLIACESGIPDTVDLPEEYFSLPASFMLAGIPCVVSALWKVPEEATALLIAYFYQHLFAQGGDPAEALRAAQRSLRKVTYRALSQNPAFRGLNNPGGEVFNAMCEEKVQSDPEGRPFEHPFYWAAFTVNGAASE